MRYFIIVVSLPTLLGGCDVLNLSQSYPPVESTDSAPSGGVVSDGA